MFPFGPNVLPSDPTVSHWMRSVAGDPLLTAGATAALPSSADIVIIGSGLSGAVTAYNLLSAPNPPSSVVILEARTLCSGASGRNGGHCRPDAFRGFTSYAALHGAEQAKKILKSEATTLGLVKAFVDTHGIECELMLRPTADVCLTNSFAAYERGAYDAAVAAGVDVTAVTFLDTDTVKSHCGAPDAKEGWGWSASSVNPLKLALGVYRAALSASEAGSLAIFTQAPVTAVTEAAGNKWAVGTPRGRVVASKVIHATNAYSPLLLPELKDLVIPFRAQAVRLQAPPTGAPLRPTMSLRRELEYFYSVAPQPDNSVVLSCSRRWEGQSDADYAALYDNMDDSAAPVEQAKDTTGWVARTLSPSGWKGDERDIHSHWSGIIGWTPDLVPFVGPVPGKEGQYVMAGFNGHGMARIFHTAPCLARIVLEGMHTWDPEVPTAFRITKERISALRKKLAADAKVDVESQAKAKL